MRWNFVTETSETTTVLFLVQVFENAPVFLAVWTQSQVWIVSKSAVMLRKVQLFHKSLHFCVSRWTTSLCFFTMLSDAGEGVQVCTETNNPKAVKHPQRQQRPKSAKYLQIGQQVEMHAKKSTIRREDPTRKSPNIIRVFLSLFSMLSSPWDQNRAANLFNSLLDVGCGTGAFPFKVPRSLWTDHGLSLS